LHEIGTGNRKFLLPISDSNFQFQDSTSGSGTKQRAPGSGN
jgi:hypothetical protein